MIRRLIILLLIVGCEEVLKSIKEGCTTTAACNYDAEAMKDDGSCLTNDCAGECGGLAVVDSCAVCDIDSSNDCTQDCAGDWGGFAVMDTCGGCIDRTCTYGCTGGSTGIEPSYQDCFGTWCGWAIEDCVGDCDGNAGTFDCNGICGGTDIEDCEGTCGGSAGVLGCDGVCDSGMKFDDCGVCGGQNSCFTAVIGVEYIASDNLTVTLNELTITEKIGSYEYSIFYKLVNNTTSQQIDEGSFKMYYKDRPGGKVQYGFFNDLFPGDSTSRQYTFEELKSKKFSKISYCPSRNCPSNEPDSNALIWQVAIP